MNDAQRNTLYLDVVNSEVTIPGVTHIGDLLLTFGLCRGELAARTQTTQWRPVAESVSWKLSGQSMTETWKGFPLASSSIDTWRIWLLGELYGASKLTPISSQDLEEFVSGKTKKELNGHFMLLAWNSVARRWHIWTSRFGTLHAYYATDGKRTAIGTYFAAVAAAASHRQMDWVGLTGFFSFGFFPQGNR